jgi:hypothetical protein
VILEPSLAKFIASRDGTKRAVILEVKSAPVSAPVRSGTPGVSKAARGRKPRRASDGFAELERALAAMQLSPPPVLLERVGIAVVEVTSEQLEQLARLPILEAIRPNRTHRAPRTQLAGTRR